MANNCLGPIFLDLLFSFSNTHSMFFDTFNGLVSYFFSSLKIFLIIPIWRYCGFLWVFVSEFNSLIHVDMFVEAWLGGRGQFVSMCLVSRKIPKNLLHFLCCIVFPPAANEWESLFCMSFGYSVLCLGGILTLEYVRNNMFLLQFVILYGRDIDYPFTDVFVIFGNYSWVSTW